MGKRYDDFHWEIMSGETRTFRIPVKDPDTGAAVNIAGATFWATAKRQLTDTDANAEFQLTSGAGDIVITDAANGIATATIQDELTKDLSQPITLLLDVKIKQAGEPTSLTTGKLTVLISTTRATV